MRRRPSSRSRIRASRSARPASSPGLRCCSCLPWQASATISRSTGSSRPAMPPGPPRTSWRTRDCSGPASPACSWSSRLTWWPPWRCTWVFSPAGKPISALAAGLRFAYAGVFAVAVFQLAGAARLLGGGTSLPASGANRVHAQALSDISRFTDIWHAGLIVFGLYLLVIAWLAWTSGYVPKLLGVLIAIAGLGYIYDSIGAFISGGSWTQVSTVTFIGEFLLALWLVIRGRRITVSQPALRAEQIGRAHV